MSQAIRKSPAEVLDIRCGIRAYSFNRAVWLFGSTLQAALDEAGKEKRASTARMKQQAILNSWLDEPGRKGLYKDPAAAR